MRARSSSADVGGAALSADGKKLLVRSGGGFKLYDVKKGASGEPVSTSGLEMDLDPVAEWGEVFDETWRIFRDYFYVENMHGYDWQALGDSTASCCPTSPTGPTSTMSSPRWSPSSTPATPIFRAAISRSPTGPRWRCPAPASNSTRPPAAIASQSIFRGQNEEPKYRSPLTEVGVDIGVGDYVLAIDGRELKGTDNPYRLLQHLEDSVTLTVNSKPGLEGAREVTYVPRGSETSLLYLDWVLGNLDRVNEMTDGKVGYLHIPDMGPDGIAEFIKWFYPQIRKEGLIVDVRGNGGGNVSAMIIERLSREILGTRFGRTSDLPGTYPQQAFNAHMACLISETSASDGDIFPHYFREAGLGPLIGKRTWGGVVGGGNIGLIDGGTVFVPRSATNDRDGEYIIEGIGVAPDIEVTNDPAVGARGRGPAARARRRRGPRGHGGGAQEPADATRGSGEDTGLELSKHTHIIQPGPGGARASGAVFFPSPASGPSPTPRPGPAAGTAAGAGAEAEAGAGAVNSTRPAFRKP